MQISPITGTIGADITGVDLATDCTDAVRDNVVTALDTYGVVAIRGQSFDIDSFETCAQRFGSFGDTPFITPVEGHPNVLRLLRDADETGPIFGSGWHSDWSFQDAPPSYTMLYAVQVPDAGGDTAYIDQSAAYEALSPTMREFCDGLHAVHSAARSYGPRGTFGRPDPRRSMEIIGSDEALRTHEHPLVRVHPNTGRRSLFINDVYTVGIAELPGAEGRALLDFLLGHCRQIQFTVRVRWAPGTLTMWDNRMVQHFAIGDYSGHRREMLRITLAGDTPTGVSN